MKTKLIAVSLFCFTLTAAKKADTENLIVVQAAPATASARVLKMGDTDVGTIQARIRHNTMLVFPEGELVTVAQGGDVDKGRWVMESPSKTRQTNVFSVKPARAGADAETDLNIVTSANHSYSFRFLACDKCAADVKVFVSHKDPIPEVVPVDDHLAEIERLSVSLDASRAVAKREVEAAKKAKLDADARIEKEIADFRAQYPLSMRSDYVYKNRNKPPFNVQAIWSDDTHTFIQLSGELTSIYTFMDNKPELTQYSYHRGTELNEGTYVVDKVLRNGYLQLGKKSKLRFDRIEKAAK